MDIAIWTDRKIKSNRLDIVVKDYKIKTCLLIDMLVSRDNNIPVKEYDKISENKYLEIEIETVSRLNYRCTSKSSGYD